MKIAIIGAGNVGGTLGKKWAAAGHTVWYGVRNPADSKFDGLRDSGQVSGVEEALAAGEVILVALPGGAVAEFATAFGAGLDGKLVMDATNNFRGEALNNLGALAEHAPGARLVRAFNTLGWENFETPEIDGVQVDLVYCGDERSRAVADELIHAVGLRPVYLGGMEQIELVDNLVLLWFALVQSQGYGRRVALKMLGE